MKNAIAFFFGWLLAALLMIPHARAAVTVSPIVSGYSSSSGRFASVASGFSMTAANDGYIAQSVTNVGGRAVTMPATMRMAANAGQIAKTAMRLNPYLIAGTLAVGWLLENAIQPDGNGGFTITVTPDCLGQTVYASTGYVYSSCYRHPDSDAWWNGQAPAPMCPSPYVTFDHGGFTPAYRYCGLVVPAGSTTRPATSDDFDALPDPLPAVGPELPYAPYMPDGAPVTVPEYAPQTVPVGDPYTRADGSTAQPMARISPAGNGQVTIDTYDQPLTDPSGNPVANPQPEDTAEPTPSDCEAAPNSLGCLDVGTPPAADPLPSSTVNVSFTPIDMPKNATCPAPEVLTLGGHSIPVSYDAACYYAEQMHPFVLIVATLGAAYIIFGVRRGGES